MDGAGPAWTEQGWWLRSRVLARLGDVAAGCCSPGAFHHLLLVAARPPPAPCPLLAGLCLPYRPPQKAEPRRPPCLRPCRELDALGSRRLGLELLSRPLPVGLLLALSAFPTSPQLQAAASVQVASWGRSSSCYGFTCTSDRAWAPVAVSSLLQIPASLLRV